MLDYERFFPFFPKGWVVIALVTFTLLSFLVYSVPLSGTQTYEALLPYVFVVTFLMMMVFSPRESWTNFKTAYFFNTPKITDKLIAIGALVGGAVSGYFVYLFLSSMGMTILAFPSGLTLMTMGTLLIIVTYFIVSLYEELFTVWFSGTIANNLNKYFESKDNLWVISIIFGTIIWCFTHIIAVGLNLGAFLFIFSLGLTFRMVGILIGKSCGGLYNPYYAIAFHWVYDVCFAFFLGSIW